MCYILYTLIPSIYSHTGCSLEADNYVFQPKSAGYLDHCVLPPVDTGRERERRDGVDERYSIQ